MDAALIARIGADLTDLRSKMEEGKGIIGGFTNHVSKIGPAVAAAFSVGAIVAFGKAALNAAGEAVDGENRLLVALHGREDIQQRLLRQADSMAEATLFEDDAIIKQQGLLAAMGRSEDQINSIIRAAAQLAAVTGSELGVAVEALNKTYEGQEKSLKALDPTLHGFTEAQLKSGEVIDIVRQKYEGYAESMTQIGSGPMTEFKQLLGEITEEAGRAILPITNDLLSDAVVIIKSLKSDDLTPWQKFYGTVLQWDASYLRELNEEIEKTKKLKEAFEASLESTPGWRGAGMAKNVGNEADPKRPKSKAAPDPGFAGGDDFSGVMPESIDFAGISQEQIEFYKMQLEEAKAADEAYTNFLADELEKRQELEQEDMDFKLDMAGVVGEIMSSSTKNAIAGQKDFASALKQAALGIIATFAAQAIAAAMAKAILNSTFTGDPFSSVATAAAVGAAVSALFASMTGGINSAPSGGGGGGGGGYSGRENSALLDGSRQTMRVEVVGRISGRDLDIIGIRQSDYNGYTQPAFVPIGG